MTVMRRLALPGLVLIAGPFCAVAPAEASFLAAGSFGGGSVPDSPALVGGAGTHRIALTPVVRSPSRHRLRATLSASCGTILVARTVTVSGSGRFSFVGRVVRRVGGGSTVASVRLSGTVDGSRAAGTAAVRLRVRSGGRVRRCVAPATPFALRRVRSGVAAPAAAPAVPGSLYAGLTAQSTRSRPYPMVLRTSPGGRALTGLTFDYFCQGRDGGTVDASDTVNRGAITADGRFTWRSQYVVPGAGDRVSVTLRVTGRFLDGQVRGRITTRTRVSRAGRTLARCAPPEAIAFTASL